MRILRNTTVPTIGLIAVLAASHAQAQTTLFRDTFSRSDGTDLNATATGKSGSLGQLDWVEIDLGGDASINSSRINLDHTSGDGNAGIIAYPDANFDGLSAFTVEIRLLNGSSGGDGRFVGFSVGQSKAELDAATGASPGRSVGDFYIGYDNIGGSRGLNIRHNGVNQGTTSSTTLPGFGFPDTLTVNFSFDDMNTGTTLNYEVFLTVITNDPPIQVTTGSTTWSGTDENYIALHSTYTGGSFINYFDVTGVLAPTGPPADLSGDGDVDDEDLGLFFSAFTGPDNGPSPNPAADLSGDGDVDDEDLGQAFSAFTGPLGPASVPEPTSLALLGLGGLALSRRCR